MKLTTKILFTLCLISWFCICCVYAEGLNIKGSIIRYMSEGETVTEGLKFPDDPIYLDTHVDPSTGIVWKWDGGKWICKRTTQDIKDEIAIFKANLSQVNDPEAKKCLKSLGKVLLKLYQQTLE